MNMHKNARLTPKGREHLIGLVKSGLSLKAASRAVGVSPRTTRKWLNRFDKEGAAGLVDRSSRPLKLRQPTPAAVVAHIIDLRHRRLTGKHIAKLTGVSPATVSRVLKRAGISRLKDLEPKEPERRYVHDNPGDMIHIDIKPLVTFDSPGHRVTGSRKYRPNLQARKKAKPSYEYLHVCIDDHSRIAFTDIFADQTAKSAVRFLEAAVAYYKQLDVTVTRVLTDNGGCYRSRAFARTCKKLGIRHVRTQPYRPRTNGKAERFIKTAIIEWAYGLAYQTSHQRNAYLPEWTHNYNWHRPHSAIKDQTPISKLNWDRNNLLRLHN